jgi:hypothetical protein
MDRFPSSLCGFPGHSDQSLPVIESFRSSDVGTIPDIFTESAIAEIKSSQYVYMSSQIEMQAAYANYFNYEYYVIVSPQTQVAETVVSAAAETNGGVYVFDAVAGTFTEYGVAAQTATTVAEVGVAAAETFTAAEFAELVLGIIILF